MHKDRYRTENIQPQLEEKVVCPRHGHADGLECSIVAEDRMMSALCSVSALDGARQGR